MRARLPTLAVLLAALATAPTQAQSPRPTTVQLTAGIHVITAEVADSDTTRTRGLMFRRSLPANHGMLFVFDAKSKHCMWMRNTLIPLSVAFLDEQGRILNIEDMKPQTEDNHCAARPARFALEMNQGWFASRGIKAGARIDGVQRAPAPR